MADTAYRGLVLFRAVIALWFVWAIIGTYYYEELLKYLGWDTIGFELRVSLFLGLTVAGLALISLFGFGAYRLFQPARKRR